MKTLIEILAWNINIELMFIKVTKSYIASQKTKIIARLEGRIQTVATVARATVNFAKRNLFQLNI